MNLSTKGRYAVMAMVDLARQANGKPVALNEIAQRQEISLSYLEQLFARLRRGGLVVSARGPGGGYRLARSPEETRIADIMLAVDEPIKATRCEVGSPRGCTGTGPVHYARSVGRVGPADSHFPECRHARRRGQQARSRYEPHS